MTKVAEKEEEAVELTDTATVELLNLQRLVALLQATFRYRGLVEVATW